MKSAPKLISAMCIDGARALACICFQISAVCTRAGPSDICMQQVAGHICMVHGIGEKGGGDDSSTTCTSQKLTHYTGRCLDPEPVNVHTEHIGADYGADSLIINQADASSCRVCISTSKPTCTVHKLAEHLPLGSRTIQDELAFLEVIDRFNDTCVRIRDCQR